MTIDDIKAELQTLRAKSCEACTQYALERKDLNSNYYNGKEDAYGTALGLLDSLTPDPAVAELVDVLRAVMADCIGSDRVSTDSLALSAATLIRVRDLIAKHSPPALNESALLSAGLDACNKELKGKDDV